MADRSSPSDLHVVFGAGQVGELLAQHLQSLGYRVRVARRSAREVAGGLEMISGDAADPAFCARACEGAAVVYHCMNPPYDTKLWAELVPRYMENLIAAAGRAGARLVVLDNVYMLGRPADGVLDENTPVNPQSRKGEIRARAAERLFEAHRRGEVRAVSGRASDFYGPNGRQTQFGDFFWPRALAGSRVWAPLNPDTRHTYHYIPDVVSGLATLGIADEDALGRWWMLPCNPAETTRELVARLSKHLGRGIKVARLPGWIIKGLGLALPMMRELGEMLYQWDGPFVASDRQFRERFAQRPTDPDAAAAATVAWAKATYVDAPV
ncbi:MAG TPA: NAD-dependent epimerase/dehydratase family protein [Vicinamibacterales bacterium]